MNRSMVDVWIQINPLTAAKPLLAAFDHVSRCTTMKMSTHPFNHRPLHSTHRALRAHIRLTGITLCVTMREWSKNAKFRQFLHSSFGISCLASRIALDRARMNWMHEITHSTFSYNGWHHSIDRSRDAINYLFAYMHYWHIILARHDAMRSHRTKWCVVHTNDVVSCASHIGYESMCHGDERDKSWLVRVSKITPFLRMPLTHNATSGAKMHTRVGHTAYRCVWICVSVGRWRSIHRMRIEWRLRVESEIHAIFWLQLHNANELVWSEHVRR